MPSTFAWLDHDESARRRMREIVGLFQESGTLDELGMGRIRDAFSDRFFPGTSVLWRRARYLLFVPWTYQQIERDGFARHPDAERAARSTFRHLRDALRTSGDTAGVIGLRRADPTTPPDAILWPALRQWGIRDDGGATLSNYRAALLRKPRPNQEGDDTTSVWHPRLPPDAPGFPSSVTFSLRPAEARFIADLALAEDARAGTRAARRKESMLAVLLRVDELLECDAPWEHPVDPRASSDLNDALHLAGCFADTIQGARLLYALRLAQLRRDDVTADETQERLERWAGSLGGARAAQLERWAADFPAFWSCVMRQNPRIGRGERLFVEEWARVALADPAAVVRDSAAIRMVEEREALAKGAKRARLTAAPGDDRGGGGAIPERFTYRWANALQIARDIRAGLES